MNDLVRDTGSREPLVFLHVPYKILFMYMPTDFVWVLAFLRYKGIKMNPTPNF